MRILLVEDSPQEARLIQEEVSDLVDVSFELIWVDSLSKGIEKLKEKIIDVILLDLTLPDSKGIETLFKLQAHERKIPVIILTSLYDEGLAIQALKHGAQDYLFKGQIESSLLARSVRYAVERHKILMDLEYYTKRAQASEARFRNLIEKNPNGIVIVNRDGIILFANEQTEKLLGKKVRELEGEQFLFPLISGQTKEVEISNEDRITRLEITVIETEWDGEMVHYVLLRDITKVKHTLSL